MTILFHAAGLPESLTKRFEQAMDTLHKRTLKEALAKKATSDHASRRRQDLLEDRGISR